jgi:hypothetical protein
MEVSEVAVAEIPEPVPVPAAQGVEGLIGGAAEEPLPIDGGGINLDGRLQADHVVLIPGREDQRDLPQLSSDDVVVRLDEVRPTALLIAHLHDLLRDQHFVLGAFALRDVVTHGFLDVDVLASGHGVERHGDVPVIRCADDYAVDVFPPEHPLKAGRWLMPRQAKHSSSEPYR